MCICLFYTWCRYRTCNLSTCPIWGPETTPRIGEGCSDANWKLTSDFELKLNMLISTLNPISEIIMRMTSTVYLPLAACSRDLTLIRRRTWCLFMYSSILDSNKCVWRSRNIVLRGRSLHSSKGVSLSLIDWQGLSLINWILIRR